MASSLTPQKLKQTTIALFIRCLMGGGIEKMFLNLSKNFASKGLNVHLILSQKGGKLLNQVSPNVKIIDLKASWLPSSLPKLVQYLKQEKPNTLLAAGHYCSEIAILSRFYV